jgi:phosphate transport system permease protein
MGPGSLSVSERLLERWEAHTCLRCLDLPPLEHDLTTASTANVETGAPDDKRRRSTRSARITEWVVKSTLIACASFSIFVTVSIVVLLSKETLTFFSKPEVSLSDFLLGTRWTPLLGNEKHYGIWPLIGGTMYVTVVAMTLALPLGLVTAVYLSEYASTRTRAFLKPVLEILAGIPTVVYGLFALIFITPSLKLVFDPIFDLFGSGRFEAQNVLSAGIAVGILCLPIVSSLCEDALRAVPSGLRDGAYGLGGTKFDVTVRVVLPAALSGIISSFLLAVARAVGETMVVALAAGNIARLTADPRVSAQTMTGLIAQMAKGDIDHQGAQYYSAYAVAAVLFLMTLSLTLIGHWIRQRFREAYE